MHPQNKTSAFIFPYNDQSVGDPVVIWPISSSDRAIRFIHTEPMAIGSQFLIWSKSVGKAITWYLYAVHACEQGPGESFTVSARFTSAMQQNLTQEAA